MNIKIKDIPIDERPRERLKNKGASNLSDEELLAIILKTGTKEISVKTLSLKIISMAGGIKNLKKLQFEQLLKIKGMGEVKACTLLACIELTNRFNKEVQFINKVSITSANTVYQYYKDIIGEQLQEHFFCLYLDNKKRVIKDKLLFIGTVNKSLIHPREIFKESYLLSASSIICVHNHPSGNVIPSNEDFLITEKLVDIGNLLDIKVNDHVIITKNGYYSFFENGHI